jgi:hypothetical protein
MVSNHWLLLFEEDGELSFLQGRILWKIPPPPHPRKYWQISFGDINMKRGTTKKEEHMYDRKRKKGEKKRKMVH